MKKISVLFLSLLFTLILNASPSGQWHGQMDGPKGQGSFYYHLTFGDSTVSVLKQSKGGDITEVKKYTLISDNEIVFDTNDVGEIDDFSGATFLLYDNHEWRCTHNGKSLILRPYSGWKSFAHLMAGLIFMIMLNELFRRFRVPTLLFYILIPFVLIPVLNCSSSHDPIYWFKWVKLYSVVFAAIWFTFMRYTRLGEKNYAKFIAMGFLAVNIAEAVTQDFSMHYLANNLNAVAGILSIITLTQWKGIHTENTKLRDMVWPAMGVLWIVAYDVWNIVFVYLNFPGSTGNQLVVLLACTIPALFIKKGTWLQARAFTLAAWFMYFFVFPEFIESKMILIPRPEWAGIAAGVFSLGINGILAILHFSGKLKVRQDLTVAQPAV